MNRYRKRIDDLERKREQKLKIPVIVAAMPETGVYIYGGKIYSKEQFRNFMERVKPETIILDDTKLGCAGML